MTDDRAETIREFHEAVNMTGRELEAWLETDASREAGQHEDGGESVGHASGRRILDLLAMRRDDYTEDDLAHMRKVQGFVARHLAQRPDGDVSDTTWRHSLMNWGHDPLK